MSQPTPNFLNRDAAQADFWNERFERDFLPWDRHGVPENFRRFAQTLAPRPVLIPGCGNAWEAQWLAARGWPVTAIDFAEAAVAAARRQLGVAADCVIQADFFAYTPPAVPLWIYERAFLCALPPRLWQDWAERVASLLPAGGVLAGYFFLSQTVKGPPFGIGAEHLRELLTPHFELETDAVVADSVPVFEGKERWQVWRRL